MDNVESTLISNFINRLNKEQINQFIQIIKMTTINENMNLKVLLEVLKRKVKEHDVEENKLIQIKCIKTGYKREFKLKEINLETNTLTVFDEMLLAMPFLNNAELEYQFGEQNESRLLLEFIQSTKVNEFLRVVNFRIL